MSQTRSSLLSRIKDLGDGTSWEEFDQVYRPLLVRYALSRRLSREESEEIAQQCMATIAEGIQQFQRRVSFRGWLRRMVDNKVNDQLRRRRREHSAKTRDFDREQTTEANPALLWERQWNRTHLLYCLNHIRNEVSPLTYQAFDLYVIRELPVVQIAERLGMSPNQIYVAKHRVLTRIKKRWGDLADGLL
ncbi:MAG TPA: sigma-70 family RNA polymerase sigma factor [Phycisphaerae bacterium]|nr:sigma-70 family RNA polymerase sigma factor [Phycisphaerae bacterium]